MGSTPAGRSPSENAVFIGKNGYSSRHLYARWGCVLAIDSNGQTIWIADAHRDDGKRFASPLTDTPAFAASAKH